MEHLLEMIEEETEGIPINEDTKVPILTFADDIVIMGNDQKEAQKQLNMVTQYLNELGMKLSAKKCQTFQIVAENDTWYVKDPVLKTGIETIPKVDPDEVFKYLGSKMGPWKGLHQSIIIPDIVAIIKRVRKLALKPQQ